MGQISVNIGMLTKDIGQEKTISTWFPLQERGKNEDITGSIHLSITLSKTQQKNDKKKQLFDASFTNKETPRGLPLARKTFGLFFIYLFYLLYFNLFFVIFI